MDYSSSDPAGGGFCRIGIGGEKIATCRPRGGGTLTERFSRRLAAHVGCFSSKDLHGEGEVDQGLFSGCPTLGAGAEELGCNIGGPSCSVTQQIFSVLAVHSWKMHDNNHRQVERLPKPGGTPRRRRQLG